MTSDIPYTFDKVAADSARSKLTGAMAAIDSNAEGRDLSAEENTEFESLNAQVKRHDSLCESRGKFMVKKLPTQASGKKPADAAEFKSAFLRSDQSFIDYSKAKQIITDDAEPLDFQKYLRGVATGNWHGAEPEMRASLETGAGGGANLVPVILSGQVVDLARSLSTCLRAGSRVLPMQSGMVDIGTVINPDVSMGWRDELAAIAETEPNFGKISMVAKSCGAIVRASVEFLEDSVGGADLITQLLSSAMSQEVDRVCLSGAAANKEPIGLDNHADINSSILGGGADGAAITSYDALSAGIFQLAGHNAPAANIYCITSPEVAAGFDVLQDASGFYLTPSPATIGNLTLQTGSGPHGVVRGNTAATDPMPSSGRWLTSSKVVNDKTVGTSTGVCSSIYLGDFSAMVVGMRGDMTIQVLNERYADTGEIGFLIRWRQDVALTQPKHFLRIDGVIA